MLRELQCEQFNQKVIKFNNGLNIITGGDGSANSIGKTTLLLIIDFCLGGEEFQKTNVYKEQEEFVLKFSLEFNDGMKYFVKKKSSKKVFVCDEQYNVISEITHKEYTEMLKNNYYNDNVKTFRQLQYKFVRTSDIKKFDYKALLLSYGKKDNNIDVISDLYNEYKEINDKILEIETNKKITKAYTTLNTDKNNKFLITKTEYKKLSNDLADVDDFIDNFHIDKNAENSNEKINLFDQYLKCIRKENKLEEKLACLQNEIIDDIDESNNIDEVLEYFPDINKAKLDNFAIFHNDIKKILKNEINEEIDVTKSQIISTKERIDKISNKLEKDDKNSMSEYINNSKLIKNVIKRKDIEDKIKIYEQYENKINRNKELNQEILEKQSIVLEKIAKNVNAEMKNMNDKVKNGETKLSTFVFEEKNCKLINNEDDGSGCSIQNMIYFDLSLLKLSSLKFLIHDKEMINNIDKAKWSDILKLYCNTTKDKQIFLVIDDIGNIDANGKKIIEEYTVLSLSEKNKLLVE